VRIRVLLALCRIVCETRPLIRHPNGASRAC
jgi:hypothetical protein